MQNSGTQRGTVCDEVPGGILCHVYPRPAARGAAIGMSTAAGKTGRGHEKSYRLLAKTIKNGKPEKQNNHTTAAKDHHENVYLPRIPNFPVTPNLAYNLNLHNSTPRHCVRTEAPRYPRTAEAKVPWQIALIHT